MPQVESIFPSYSPAISLSLFLPSSLCVGVGGAAVAFYVITANVVPVDSGLLVLQQEEALDIRYALVRTDREERGERKENRRKGRRERKEERGGGEQRRSTDTYGEGYREAEVYVERERKRVYGVC